MWNEDKKEHAKYTRQMNTTRNDRILKEKMYMERCLKVLSAGVPSKVDKANKEKWVANYIRRQIFDVKINKEESRTTKRRKYRSALAGEWDSYLSDYLDKVYADISEIVSTYGPYDSNLTIVLGNIETLVGDKIKDKTYWHKYYLQ